MAPYCIHKIYILGRLTLKFTTWKQKLSFVNSIFVHKYTYFEFFKEAIRHISMAIRHMWWVTNGLDNAGLKVQKCAFGEKNRSDFNLPISPDKSWL